MALTAEVIRANAILTGLTDEQIAAITTLSTNDENTVIGSKIGEIYRQMDTTIKTTTGVDRDGDEKTYNYLERAAKALKEQAGNVTTLNKQIGDLTKEKTRLEKVISEGGTDKETKSKLDQATKDLTAIQKQYNELKTEHDSSIEKQKAELFNIRMDGELGSATSGFKFKAELPKSAVDVLVKQAIDKVKAMSPEFIKDDKGAQTLVFKDETGAVMHNPENQLNPFTASELIGKELKTMGVLEEVRKQQGSGTVPPVNRTTTGNTIVDISGAKTRVEANDMATKTLLENGYIKGSKEFTDQMTQIWTDNNVKDLPAQ